MKLILLLLVLPLQLWAQGQVLEVRSPREIIVDLFEPSEFKINEILFIFSRQEKRLIAFGRLKEVNLSLTPAVALVSIEEVVDNSLLMAGDFVYPLSDKSLVKQQIPGFFSLTLSGSKKTPAQYKQLAYLGVFTSDGHTLDKGEVLISPFQIQYGLTNDFGMKVVNALLLDGYGSLGFKYQLIRNTRAKFSLNTLGGYKVQSQDWIWQMGGVLTLPSNAKFQSHLAFNFTLDPQFQDANATEGLDLFKDSDIRNIYEYITDSWNRVLFGPTYNVELQTFGGTLSYMWIWDVFHMSLGMATRDFAKLEVGKKGYYYVYDFFWRF